MLVITQRSIILGVSKAWDTQYGGTPDDPHHELIGKRLRELDLSTASKRTVNKIIGNDSWTRLPACDECGQKNVPVSVRVGQEPDWESRTATLCVPCLCKAVKEAEAQLSAIAAYG